MKNEQGNYCHQIYNPNKSDEINAVLWSLLNEDMIPEQREKVWASILPLLWVNLPQNSLQDRMQQPQPTCLPAPKHKTDKPSFIITGEGQHTVRITKMGEPQMFRPSASFWWSILIVREKTELTLSFFLSILLVYF